MYRYSQHCFAAIFAMLIWCGQCKADKASEREEAVSLVSGYFANFEAVEAFDVVFKCDSQWVADNGYIEEGVFSGRMIVDLGNNRCFSVVDHSLTKLVGSKDGAVEKKLVALHAVSSDGKKAWTRSIPEVASRMSSTKLTDVLRHNNSLYLPAIGMMEFPFYYSQAADFRDLVDAARYGAVEYKITGNGVASRTVTYKIAIKDVFTITRSTAIDRTNLKPTSFSETATLPDGKVLPKVRERYRFTDNDGIFLPIEISGEKRRARLVGETKVNGMETYDVRFKWMSVNKQLDDKYFSPQLLSEVEKLMDMVKFEEVKEKQAR